MQTQSNHPVHIIDQEGKLSPSAFIPFCQFGRDTLSMGVKIDQFDFPVCNSFQAQVLNDQLCYQVDLEQFKHRDNIENNLKSGLVLIIDYNKDRQVTLEESMDGLDDGSKYGHSWIGEMVKSDDAGDCSIHLDSIGEDHHLSLIHI